MENFPIQLERLHELLTSHLNHPQRCIKIKSPYQDVFYCNNFKGKQNSMQGLVSESNIRKP
ncbi:CLUMA_CG008894, isoform A [Clunio marinus]|uniref:CLUMA_CG008894, isoform A n=1 Tax=Clunio marinus TaxID=568069 RepID=A0A1J1I4U5_9DIPT|nr:CLUMA_CG008894, isoform A [Clunio marinus]